MTAAMHNDLNALPLLDAFERFTGSFLDLDRGLEMDASALRDARDHLAKRLRRTGLAAADRALINVGNGPCFVAALAAVLSEGACPILVHAETPPAELKRFAEAYGARFALSDTWSETEMGGISTIVSSLDITSAARIVCAEFSASEVAPERFPALQSVPLHPTSGTTGVPKIALRPAPAAIREAHNYQETMAVASEDVILCVVPMSHGYGFGTSVTVPLVSGARVISSRRFQPHVVQRALAEHPVTMFPAVPAMLHLFLVASRGRVENIPRRVLSAGAPLSEQTARAFFEATKIPARSLYGTTETGGISVDVDSETGSLGGCVGRPMRSIVAEIRPVPDSTELKEGIGRVWIKSPSVMAGYLSKDGIDSSAIVDGWFHTGDLGELDESGRIHLVGRESEVINVFGMKVIPSEVEDVIALAPGVTDVKVYAGRHRSGSQIVKAVIAATDSLDLAALRAHCVKNLVPYKRPEVITQLESLPRTPTGKIIRDQLP
jgi:acyl-CoA synthetase (AMP-forming)/AMP-acid ligase II